MFYFILYYIILYYIIIIYDYYLYLHITLHSIAVKSKSTKKPAEFFASRFERHGGNLDSGQFLRIFSRVPETAPRLRRWPLKQLGYHGIYNDRLCMYIYIYIYSNIYIYICILSIICNMKYMDCGYIRFTLKCVMKRGLLENQPLTSRIFPAEKLHLPWDSSASHV